MIMRDFLPGDGGPDWSRLGAFDFIADMGLCPQDSRHHGEGDVLTHTKMVVDSLLSGDRWKGLSDEEREDAFVAALLHDIGKPSTTKEEEGRITARNHSIVGAIMARRLLWEAGCPFPQRERICSIIRVHQIPFYLIEKPEWLALATASRTGLCASNKVLAAVADADGRGRICSDMQRISDNVELFSEMCRDFGCYEGPFDFPSDHTRFTYFRNPEGRLPEYEAHDDASFTFTLMSGMPGAGKDTWIAENGVGLPVVSLDDIRREMRIAPDDKSGQGTVVQAAKEAARRHLRSKTDFIWNATNISRQQRAQVIDLAVSYGARVRVVYVEPPADDAKRRNRERDHAVPQKAVDRMLDKWEPPTPDEAHELVVVAPGVEPDHHPVLRM